MSSSQLFSITLIINYELRRVDFLKYLNSHLNRYSVLNYQIRLFSMILINSNSKIENYGFKCEEGLSSRS